MLDGIDLNGSLVGQRYDQHFDSQISQDHSMENYSSRVHYGTGAPNDLSSSMRQLKRSETENVRTFGTGAVTFAQGEKPTNNLMHYKTSRLERIDESKSRTPSRHRSSNNAAGLQQVQQNSPGKQNSIITNINDISQLTVNSNRLEDSVKAPGRLALRIPGLMQFLIDQHYKKLGVFTKCDKELFKFWKEYVSAVYRHQRKMALLGKSITAHLNDKTLTFNEPKPESAPLFETSDKSILGQYRQYEKLYEMDVAYTIQKELEDENIEFKKIQTMKEQEMKQSFARDIKEKEESIIKWTIEAYYAEVKAYHLTNPDYQQGKEEESFKQWHKQVALKQLQAQGKIHVESSKKKKEGAVKVPKPVKTPEELAKEVAVKKEKETIIDKSVKEEAEFMKNLFLMLREMNTITNSPGGCSRIYRDQKEKARFGVIWAKGEDDAEKMIFRFFRPERIIRRLQILYDYKCQKEGKYKHLSLFGFYIQMKQRSRLLHLIDWPLIRSDKLVVAKIDQTDPEKQLKSLDFLLRDDQMSTISIEELCVNYEIYVKLQTKLHSDAKHKSIVETMQKDRDKLLVSVFGKDKKLQIEQNLAAQKTDNRLTELAKPKDKWKRLKILMDLKKKFAHDLTLEKMIKEELKVNKVFKFPEEYDLYDDHEDKLCKHMGEKGIQTKDLSAGKTLREKFKVLDNQDLYYLKREVNASRRKERELEDFLINHALQYIEGKKKRLLGEKTTVRLYVSKVYNEMVQKFPDLAKERFPHNSYGTKKDSETYKKSYPLSFKSYFFRIVKSHFTQKKGIKRIKNPAPTFMIAGGKRCLIHTDQACPEGCQYGTFNQKVVLRSTMQRKILKEPPTFRSRVWRRNDFKNAINKVLMLHSEQENCTFEPEAGSMSKTIELALRANPNLRKDGLIDEADPEVYVKKHGANFEKSHPEVYKKGVLKRAILMFKEGKYDDALKRLYDGFNVDSIKKRYDPHYMQRFMAEQMLKEKEKRLSKERSATGKTSTLSTLNRVHNLQEEPESQKKKPEEDFENKKLLPILQEAFDLISTIEERKRNTQNKINALQRQQTRMHKSVRSFSTYKKSQTRLDQSKGERILFRSIMCPLKEKCPRDMRPRWPTSNTKANTKFGEDCPFAHHMNELKFPESIVTKLSSSYHTIKNLKGKLDTEKPREVFKPSGPLFDCIGCNSKSSKHIGGPCNACRYKEMAGLSSAKFVDKKRMESLRRSMEKRESVDIKEEKKEMHAIMKLLDLDNNYTIKFGLLKKACVLFFYGRFNDSFDEIAKAAKIIQDQREVEKQKQYIIEKRWKFKLGLDEGFDLPIPIDQIDPSKVDEKFLKKLDLQGVAVATLKLYIEQVAPQGREEYSKHQFLNKCIEDFFLNCESMLEDKQNTIAKMKKQVEKLDEEADLMEAFGGTSPAELSLEKSGHGDTHIKPKKTKMCPNLQTHGKCHLSSKKCNFAHNAIGLDLIPVETKMKNLQGVIQSQTSKLKNMKPLEPWRPVKSGEIIHTHLMDMTSKGRKKKGADGEEDEDNDRRKEVKRKSIFDRENIFRKPYEVNE